MSTARSGSSSPATRAESAGPNARSPIAATTGVGSRRLAATSRLSTPLWALNSVSVTASRSRTRSATGTAARYSSSAGSTRSSRASFSTSARPCSACRIRSAEHPPDGSAQQPRHERQRLVPRRRQLRGLAVTGLPDRLGERSQVGIVEVSQTLGHRRAELALDRLPPGHRAAATRFRNGTSPAKKALCG